jgi:hypothetical protein
LEHPAKFDFLPGFVFFTRKDHAPVYHCLCYLIL